jgi:hypothetical protein
VAEGSSDGVCGGAKVQAANQARASKRGNKVTKGQQATTMKLMAIIGPKTLVGDLCITLK